MPTKKGRPRRQQDLEVFTARLTPEAKERLMALARLQGKHAYKLLEDAFWTHWQQLPEATRAGAETIISTVQQIRDSTR